MGVQKLLASRSSKVAVLLKKNPLQDLCNLLRDIPTDPETFELVVRFCHGFELINLSTDKIVPLCCIAHFLGMTESHSVDNLLKKGLGLFKDRVLPSWNECVKALLRLSSSINENNINNIAKQAIHLGLVDACLDSIIHKALVDPHLLLLGHYSSSSIRPPPLPPRAAAEDDDDDGNYRPNPRRRLFLLEWESESLSTLSLRLYTAVIDAMVKHNVPSQYVAASLSEYVKKWGFLGDKYKRLNKGQREVIEAVERLLPRERGLVPCSLLFEMLRFAVSLEASSDCRNGLEMRIGTQLDQATVEDLMMMIPSHDQDQDRGGGYGYAKESRRQCDTECLRRILKNFYGNNNTTLDIPGIIKVSELMEEFLVAVVAASDMDLKMTTFLLLADMTAAASRGTRRNSDGIYRAVDVYLDKNKHLTEVEREEVCQFLDYQMMSSDAVEHAARNERLPLRVVVQVLFVGQLQLRDTITRKVEEVEEEEEERHDEVEGVVDELIGCSDEEGGVIRKEMEKMGSKVMEVERECHVIRKEIQKSRGVVKPKMVGRVGMWNAMKRKFGCIASTHHNSNCQLNKKMSHPR